MNALVAAYELFLSRRAVDFLRSCRPPERERVWRLLDQLTEQPHGNGDYQELDPSGRPLEGTVIGRLAVTWWADHAVQEVKVLQIGPSDRT